MQCRTNVFDVGPTLYKCYTIFLCLLVDLSKENNTDLISPYYLHDLTLASTCRCACDAAVHPPDCCGSPSSLMSFPERRETKPSIPGCHDNRVRIVFLGKPSSCALLTSVIHRKWRRCCQPTFRCVRARLR